MSSFGLLVFIIPLHKGTNTHTITEIERGERSKLQRFIAAGYKSNWQQMGTLALARLTSSQHLWPGLANPSPAGPQTD